MFYYMFLILYVLVSSIFVYKNGVVIYLLFKRGFHFQVIWFLFIETVFFLVSLSILLSLGVVTETFILSIILLGMFIPALNELIGAGKKKPDNKKRKSKSNGNNDSFAFNDTGWDFSSSDSSGGGSDCGGDGGGGD